MQSVKLVAIQLHPEIAFAVAPFEGSEVNPTDFFLNLSMLHGIGIRWADAFNYPSWSVSLEFWTYLIFAAICLVAIS